MKRRTFLLAGLGTGGALFMGWALLPPRQRLIGRTPPDTDGKAVALNGWLTIAPDNTITVVVPKAEMGQGIHTALAMLIAEELDGDWQRVRVMHSPIDAIYGNVSTFVEGMPFPPEADGALERTVRWMMAKTARELGVMLTGASSSLRDCWLPMREAGASARASLIAAAAQQAGKTAHAFILDAISQTVEQVEMDNAFNAVADQRWGTIQASGKTVSWDDAKVYLAARANGEPARKPTARKMVK